MDFRLSDNQVALADGIRSMVTGRLPLDHLRAKEGAERAIGAEDWRLLADTGVFALSLPEPEGVGLGLADAVVVFSHEKFPPWGRIVVDEGAGFRWQRA